MYRKFTELYGVDDKEINKRQSDLVKGDIAHWAVHLRPHFGGRRGRTAWVSDCTIRKR